MGLNRKDSEQDSLTLEDWRETIRKLSSNMFFATLVRGTYNETRYNRGILWRNAQEGILYCFKWDLSLKRFDKLYFYWISLDGTETSHDQIRGRCSYSKTRQNILEYISGYCFSSSCFLVIINDGLLFIIVVCALLFARSSNYSLSRIYYNKWLYL